MSDPSDLPPDMPPLAPRGVAALRNALTATQACQALSDQLESQFKAALAACHLRCSAADVDCLSCISGSVRSILASANEIGQTCAVKLQARVVDLTTNAMQKAADAIQYTPPDTAQANANLQMGVFPTVGPLVVPPSLPPVQVLPPPDPFAQPPAVVILPPPEPLPTAGEPPPVGQIGPPDAIPGPGMGGGACPPPVINIPPCPAPGPGPAGPPGPPGPAGPPGPGFVLPGDGPPIFVGPTYPPPSPPVILPPIEVDGSPGATVNVTVNVEPGPPAPAPQPDVGGGGPVVPAPNPANSWNQLACPGIPPPNAADFNGNWFKYLEDKTGFHYRPNGDKPATLIAPDGFFNSDVIHKLSAGETIRWWASYAVSVGLPAIGATMVPPKGSCNVQMSIADYAAILLIEFVEKWVGIDLTNLKQPSKYDINFNCPSFLPGQGAADDLQRKGLINQELWRCWTRANNNLDVPAQLVRDADRPRLGLSEAWRASYLNPEVWRLAFPQALIFEGYDSKYWDIQGELQWNIPGYNQIQNWLVARVDDPAVVARYEFDTGFPDLWSDEFAGYLQAGGTRKDVAQRDWRAHWRHIPADLAQRMAWRSRDANLSWPAGVAPVLDSDVDYLRNLEGIAPFWSDKLQAMARPVPNKRELAQLYEYKVIDAQDYVNGLMDLGYTGPNATKLVRLNDEKIKAKYDARNNAITRGQIVNAYVGGLIRPDEFRAAMGKRGVEAPVIETMLEQADFRRVIRVRHLAVKAAHLRFTSGEYTQSEAIQALLLAGEQSDEATTTVATWQQQIKDRGKHASAAQLCKWLGQNLLTEEEYYQRLINLGWPAADAKRIVASCELDAAKKATPKPKPAPKPPKGK